MYEGWTRSHDRLGRDIFRVDGDGNACITVIIVKKQLRENLVKLAQMLTFSRDYQPAQSSVDGSTKKDPLIEDMLRAERFATLVQEEV